MSFPTKEERSRCWDARDKYWECLDKSKGKGQSEGNLCKEFRNIYEKSCSAQWVKHFDRKRSYLIYKDKIENEGLVNMYKFSIVTKTKFQLKASMKNL
ncbi:hypothetical protein NQ315_007546 [Exocentrus adspersus]|uniref:Cytochrome c oxidase assembly factor 6 homolog n=1 Tax=Exocentrus adspersus TaxID=1586481 RepID=A0AAV8W7H0_9CUCU|nr:hypothetical protein NQ315_007546 [Exocentrus adspersus]